MRCNLGGLDVRLDFVSYREVFDAIQSWRISGLASYIVAANPHSIYLARKDNEMMSALAGAGLIVPDGIGTVIAGRLLGYPSARRVTGPMLTLKICDWGRAYNYRHFFYGGVLGVAEKMATNLQLMFPGMNVVGWYTPPFGNLTKQEDATITRLINDSNADVVWVGLGAPKQEKWMAAHIDRIGCAALVGVGAAFDFHSGNVPWAPRWVRETGFEWMYRVAREPKRIGPKAVDGAKLVASALSWRLRFKREGSVRSQHSRGSQ
jgi:N-acetylglucosaminyldiphosphoundecaprenol N-acetyl-beta-D-mannosaminyltransferase